MSGRDEMLDRIGGLPEPASNLRLQVINALGLMPALTRLVDWLAGALERIRPVLDRLDPRPSARRRRRDAARHSRTITVTLGVDVSAFNESMQGMVTAMQHIGRIGRVAASAGTHLGAPMHRPTYADTLAAVRAMADRAATRAIADTELTAARQHLDRHVDAIYADLGLERDPHLIRGEH